MIILQGQAMNFMNALRKTRFTISQGLRKTLSKDTVVEADFASIKQALLDADCGVTCSNKLVEKLKQHCYEHNIHQPKLLIDALKQIAITWLEPYAKTWQANQQNPHETILVFGVNGAGKTTTIAKIAHLLQTNGKQIELAAGDTFRAAAIEQLAAWGEKLKLPVIQSQQGGDSAALVFEAITKSKQNQADILIADTSGRLHNNNNLMQELTKVARVASKADANAPQHKWLVLDGTLGLNSLEQAKIFHANLAITGIIITKLDSCAKAGAIFAIVEAIKAPILFVTTGEGIDDLTRFSAKDFVENLI